MHEIFISYSSKHRPLTGELAAVLEQQYGEGSVWWDHALEGRASYATQIRAALEKSRVVVVVWTAGAMVSDYVYAEAQRALESGKLVNVRPADMSFRDIPEPFNIHHIDDAENHERILATIAKVWNGTPIQTRVPLHEIYRRTHKHRLLNWKREQLPRNPRPTELLQAKYAAVPYADVTGIAAELLAWCTDESTPTTARLLHGPGGLGKTRLLIEVAEKLRNLGWFSGFLDRSEDLPVLPEKLADALRLRGQALEQLVDHGDDVGLLLVLDYAEARRDELVRLARRLTERPESATRPIRLVLLARSAGEWWERLIEEQPELDRIARRADGQPSVAELPVIPRSEQRRALFDAARDAFAPVLAAQGYSSPGNPSSEHLQRLDDYERPLAVQMEALLWLASAAPGAGSTGVDKLLDRVLGLERAHWRKLIGGLDDDAEMELARGVGQVTLVQGVDTRPAAEQLLLADRFDDKRTSRADVDPLFRRLRQLYGHAVDGITQLEPDLIGEHHVATFADADLLDGCLHWIEAEPAELHGMRYRDLLTVLQRAAQPEHGADATGRIVRLLDQLLDKHMGGLVNEIIAVMRDTPGLMADQLMRRIDTMNEWLLYRLIANLPHYSLPLLDLSLRAAERMTTLQREKLVQSFIRFCFGRFRLTLRPSASVARMARTVGA